MKNKTIRLNHFLSSSGVCSRRKADEIIKNNTVTVNHKSVRDPSLKIHPKTDQVRLKGKPVTFPKTKHYIAFNKPKKVLTTMSDPKNRLCIADFFKKTKERIFPIGRLDWHSEGLILLTNDGDFSMKLNKKIPKTYLVKLNGHPKMSQLAKLKKGVFTEKGKLKALYAEPARKKTKNWIKVILMEGRNRQLHRMFEKIGFQIKILRRTGIGKLKLKSLKPGEYYSLSSTDIKKALSFPPEVKKAGEAHKLLGKPSSNSKNPKSRKNKL